MRHIAWSKASLKVLDQRELPRKLVYINCRSSKDVAEAIRSMALRGAPLIGCAAAYGMALAARSGSHATVRKAARELLKARPTAVNLAHGVHSQLKLAERTSAGRLASTLERGALAYFQKDLDANRRMARFGAALLKKNSNIITYCNAGTLATSGMGTALGIIRAGFGAGKVSHVFPCETRPYLQGSRLTLWELMRDKIPATLITDNAAAHLMCTSKIDAVIVGSDRIAANADVCNKIGTYALAIAARHHGVPFYVAAPSSTVDFKTPHGRRIPIEERSPAEVLEIFGRPIAPKGAKARHFAFDVTPHALVTAIITEKGVAKPPNHRTLRRLFHD